MMRELHDFTLLLDNDRKVYYKGYSGYKSLLKRVALLVKRSQKFKVIDNNSGDDVTASMSHWKISMTDEGLRVCDCAGKVVQTISSSTLPEDYLSPESNFNAYDYVRANHQFLVKKHKLE